jgi:hypothetical protein
MAAGFVVFVFAVSAGAVALVFVGAELAGKLSRRLFNVLTGVALAAFALDCWLRLPSWMISDAFVLAVAVLAGGLVGKRLPNEGAIMTFVIAGAVADGVSVSWGLTSMLLEHYKAGTSLLLQYLSISVPYGGRVIPIVGIGDLFFVGSVMFAFARLGHPRAARLLVPLGGVSLALTVAFLTRFIAALPALAVTTICYLVVRRRALTRMHSSSTRSIR